MSEHENTGEGSGRSLGRIGHRSYLVLWFSIGIRAAHQIGAAVFLAAYLLGLGADHPRLYTFLAAISGVALMLTEWLRHRQLYREVSGAVTFGKCLLLGVAMHGFLPATPTVLLAFLIASMGAHAPKNIRHKLLW